MTTIWHNPRCSKSRATLALLRENGVEPDIKLYLTDAPEGDDIRDALRLLGKKPVDIMRRGDALFKELGLSAETDDETLVKAMISHPALIERPIVFANGRAAIGRPPEAVLDIL